MAAPLAIERPPTELNSEPYRTTWRNTLALMKELDTWAPEQRPLLTDYVNALRLADEHRAEAEADAFQTAENGRIYIHPGFASADREAKRALSLAEALGITHRARKALAGNGGKHAGNADPEDPFGDIPDEVGARRQARGA